MSLLKLQCVVRKQYTYAALVSSCYYIQLILKLLQTFFVIYISIFVLYILTKLPIDSLLPLLVVTHARKIINMSYCFVYIILILMIIDQVYCIVYTNYLVSRILQCVIIIAPVLRAVNQFDEIYTDFRDWFSSYLELTQYVSQ